MEARRYLVTGKVQGVFFRASTRTQAKTLGIGVGHAVNLADGRVEVIAVGEVAALEQLAVWLHQGSRRAQVIEVTVEPWPANSVIGDKFHTGSQHEPSKAA